MNAAPARRLQGRKAIVTGAASGIGAATARAFAREGATVLVVDRDAGRAEDVVEDIAAGGGSASFFHADMGEADAIRAMIDAAVDRMGGIDILHNNTTGAVPGAVGDLPLDAWERSLRLGITPYYYATHCALPHLIASGYGSIINTSSISGLLADGGLAAYNAVKAGIINLTRNIALDYARHNVRCNAISPGIVFTTPYEAFAEKSPELIRALEASIPIRRFGRPEEIASVAVFLASDEASFVTGATIVADGGSTIRTGTPSLLDALRTRPGTAE